MLSSHLLSSSPCCSLPCSFLVCPPFPFAPCHFLRYLFTSPQPLFSFLPLALSMFHPSPNLFYLSLPHSSLFHLVRPPQSLSPPHPSAPTSPLCGPGPRGLPLRISPSGRRSASLSARCSSGRCASPTSTKSGRYGERARMPAGFFRARPSSCSVMEDCRCGLAMHVCAKCLCCMASGLLASHRFPSSPRL